MNFVNKDSTVHTVTADGGSFDSGNVQAGQTWTHTFTTPGTYAYHCVYHPWMKAKIIVLASGSAAGGVTVDIPAGTGSNDALNYAPSSLKVVLGVNSTVTFVNQDTTTHTVTADDGAFDSGNIAPGSSWSHTFNATGTFAFHCIYHSWMKGTITVLSG